MKIRVSPLLFAAAVALPATALAQSDTTLAFDEPAQGELSADDPIDDWRGQPADTWTFTAEEGQGVRISLGSDVVDTYLILRDAAGTIIAEDDDGGGNLDSLIEARLSASGEYSVSATSFAGGAGPYALMLTEIDASELPDPTRPIVDGTITIGGSASGELAPSDALFRTRDAFADTYTFAAEGGQPLEISMRSDVFDTYLVLVGPNGETVAQDDDSGMNANSRIRTVAPMAGTYRLVATSFGTRATGPYTLDVAGEFTSPTDGATELERGVATSGNLVDGEARFFFEVGASENFVIEVMSDEFDTYVMATDENEMQLAADDDGGEGTNSRARLTTYADGPVVVTVTAYSGDTTGAFTIRVSEPPPVTVNPRALRMGRSVDGELMDGDARSPNSGMFFDIYTVDARPGDVFTITADNRGEPDMYGGLSSPNLRVVSPLGEEVYDQSAYLGGGSTARRVVRATIGGTYLVAVGTWEQSMQYSIEVVEGEEAGPEWGDDATPIALGSTVDGTFDALDDTDSTHPERGTRLDVYELVLEESASVSIALSSDMFDTYLEIRTPEHALLHSNDDYDGLNSRINTTLNAGTYHIVATQFSMGEGIYTLDVQASAGGTATVSEIGVGDTLEGSFNDASTIAEYGTAAVFYQFEAAAGQELTIRATSELSDTVLTLTDAHGAQVAWNDDDDGSLNSRIALTIPRAGLYTIAVSEYGMSNGAFSVSIAEGIEGDPTPLYDGGMGVGYGEPYMDGMYDY